MLCDSRCSPKDRIKLRGAVYGKRYCWSGVGNPRNDWSIPTGAFQIQEIVNTYLVPLTKCLCGKHLVPECHCSGCKLPIPHTKCTCDSTPWKLHKPECPNCGRQTEVTLSAATVNAVVDMQNQPRTYGTLRDTGLADSEAIVNVTFGTTIIEDSQTIPPSVNLTEIQTPSTPSPFDTPR